MSEKIYDVPAEWAKRAWVDQAKYKEMYARSISDPNGFWAEQAKRIDWMKAPTKIENVSFAPGNVSIKWFEDGVLNVAHNCIDRHLHKRANQTAIIWEGDDPSQSRHITYKELHDEVCRMANILRTRNVKKGDRVTIYLPMIPEAAYAMLACARIGAIHSVVFAGFSPDSLAQRINDCQSKVIITADEGLRGGKKVPLKANVDAALAKADGVDWVVVVKRTGGKIDMNPTRDLWYHEAAAMVTTECPVEHMHAEDPLFILYTSGSTGQPKGVLHTSAGYLVYAAMTHQYVFDYHDGDIYWCTADVGWVTGHSYILYGPLANGATTLMFEGVPNYPDNSRFWNVIDKHKVNTFYTAPTAIRALMQGGDEPVKKTSRASLRLLGSVGEPINPEAWEWYHRVVGEDRCPIVDTWWQTETGGILITPLPGATKLKPGSATQPFFGVVPEIVDADGKVLEGETTGNLCLTRAWPGMMRTVYGDHARFEQTYFSTYKGKYFTGDGCRRDADGYYWITGRVDDVINVSGHRMGTAEVESALVAHEKVSEAAVVGFPHDIKGQGIYAYVTLMAGVQPTEDLRKELVTWVRKEIGPIASPDQIQFAPGLPKTRSGKIMRRILRKIAEDEPGSLGDTSTLADPAVVDDLVKNRQNKKSA
ncbi:MULTISPECIES: acetate--CoA ligase [Bradyrhizobium]|uniref:Acetyl-coenzyme A synthetase n=3 Tax=Bradyrhizobium diazoefficiens TaxID=1355477 RepID=ACSA_BRADU|nr:MULTISPECIES: acetate--CoA ligase [Bradyrhizobium]Q89WV5.2 RecName: Full=Acetyl-coenzyme A synthetase; Short=AcCoA synthetase; Short=Acs; AltName: Full=Acetate--CoA ligase; AltName: Full=Acyl-activating enzyme [Bradyrhizobium diazoefficiens USDA 110]MBP1060733.1 acetyl-CoA synthetase [Bradyrhizobium japonicum]AND93633.1 acetyl-CoA synthetase [Bradyrhizobium diazoefficiens USDA 110]APO49149.1 acetyl-coenzyme A synthetase [Bradyrhizobium diazoefficiens]AWO87722.2 acetate--CoA ligase [Bradyrhi